MESNGLKMLQRGLMKGGIIGLIKERIIKNKRFLSRFL